ncbi:DUF1707 domain-containing protein [Kitasatospora aburaviensis]
MRASDADRERVAELLRDAYAEGRLDVEEHAERIEAAYAAKTLGDLVPLTRDLPVHRAISFEKPRWAPRSRVRARTGRCGCRPGRRHRPWSRSSAARPARAVGGSARTCGRSRRSAGSRST